MRKRKPKIGLVLGSGGARGWAHLGVFRHLKKMGICPDLVVGASIGSLVGAACAADQTESLEQLALGLDWKRLLYYFFEFSLPRAGLLDGVRIERLMNELIGKQDISALPIPFCAMATDLEQGTEVALQKGDLIQAIRASISIPGIFSPVKRDGKTLVDGGLVNPLPISVAREMGADRVIAVEINLSGSPGSKPLVASRRAPSARRIQLLRQIQSRLEEKNWPVPAALQHWNAGESLPGIFEVLTQTVRIMENQITRRRLEIEPPDVLIQPRVGHIGTMDFQTAAEGMAEGEAAARAQTAELLKLW